MTQKTTQINKDRQRQSSLEINELEIKNQKVSKYVYLIEDAQQIRLICFSYSNNYGT